MKKEKLEKLRKLFIAMCLVGWILFMISVETDWLNFLGERIQILLIPLIIAISFIGMLVTFHKLDLIDAYERGRDEGKKVV